MKQRRTHDTCHLVPLSEWPAGLGDRPRQPASWRVRSILEYLQARAKKSAGGASHLLTKARRRAWRHPQTPMLQCFTGAASRSICLRAPPGLLQAPLRKPSVRLRSASFGASVLVCRALRGTRPGWLFCYRPLGPPRVLRREWRISHTFDAVTGNPQGLQ